MFCFLTSLNIVSIVSNVLMSFWLGFIGTIIESATNAALRVSTLSLPLTSTITCVYCSCSLVRSLCINPYNCTQSIFTSRNSHHCVAFCCLSASTSTTVVLGFFDNSTARLIATVVLPVPPFCPQIKIIKNMPSCC